MDAMIAGWIILFVSAAWVAFAYLGYPLVLFVLRHLSPRPVRSEDQNVLVSVIIAVHNGAAELARKLENTIALDYPGPMEIIVSSDGSTDETNQIATSFADRGVALVATEERRGKEAAQAAGIERSGGEILVFTDVGAQLEPTALRNLLMPFGDPTVGCVSSEDVVDSDGGEGLYVRFEMALRRFESEATTLVGLSGSLFAARRGLCAPWPVDRASDFRVALEAARRGLRAVAEPGARAHFSASSDTGAEWHRKVRTVRRGIAVLCTYPDLLHPRFGRAAFSVWGHKVARFSAPFALIGLLIGSALVATESPLAMALLVSQGAFYGVGAIGLAWPSEGNRLTRIAGFFLLINASMLVAWAYHLSGQRAVVWTPTRR
jgi:hypothetical protein